MGLQGLGSVAWNAGTRVLCVAGRGITGSAGTVVVASTTGIALLAGSELICRTATAAINKMGSWVPASVANSTAAKWCKSACATENAKGPTVLGWAVNTGRMLRIFNYEISFKEGEKPSRMTSREVAVLGVGAALLGNVATVGLNRFNCLKPLFNNAQAMIGSVLPLTLQNASPLAKLPSIFRAMFPRAA